MKKFESNVERDQRARTALAASGWTVLTVWECELKSSAAPLEALLANLQASSEALNCKP